MSEWKKRTSKIQIPDMLLPKTYACKVCGNKIVPNKEGRYVVKERLCTGGMNAISGTYTKPKQYDAFDCTVCGCQMIAKERMERVDEQ